MLQSERPRFDLPPASDTQKWDSISNRLREACRGVEDDPQGARGLDTLHIALKAEMTAFGAAASNSPQPVPAYRNRVPFQKGQRAINASRRCATSTKDPAKHRQAWAHTKIKHVLAQTAEEVNTARLIRSNHGLASTNPKKLADVIWGRALSSEPPDCSRDDCTAFFTDIFRAPLIPESAPSWLPPQSAPLPLKPLFITAGMVQRAIRKKGAKRSAPGPDGITYALLYRLPWLPAVLAPLFNNVISQRACPEVWRYGITTLLHKGGSKDLSNFRPITLTATISKLFHSIVACWLETALTATNTIQTTIQKGFLLGISGAIEHDLVLDAALSDAKKHHRTLFMCLVDLRNAFGSAPHSRIIWALQRFGVPAWVQDYVANFYGGVHTKMQCRLWSTDFLPVQRGVLQGDTLSPLLFLLVMQVALHGLNATCANYGYKTSFDNREHFLKCFADDLTIITRSPKRLQLALDKLGEITAWLGLEIKPSKCRSFGMGKTGYRKVDIDIDGHTILNVEDAASKFLGMELSLNQSFQEKAAIALNAIRGIVRPLDAFPLPPRDKVKLYRNFALPKMRWILLVQDILPTALRKITTEVEQALKAWWHLPRSTSRDALRLVTGIPSITDLATQSQCTKYSVAQASADPSVSIALPVRKSAHHKTVTNLLRILGGSIPQDKRKAMNLVKAEQLVQLKAKVAKLVVQGAWSQLDRTLQADKQWRTIMWSLPSSVQQFATKAAMDVLPTRANLLRWKIGCDSACQICGVKETLHHTLNNCRHLLDNGAYKWRHDSILQQLIPPLEARYPHSQVIADLPGRTYRLPFHCATDWRPDIVVNHPDHSIQFVELTVPFEPNAKTAHDRKTAKYHQLLIAAKAEGFVATLSCVEMGSRGLPSSGWESWVSSSGLPRNLTKVCSSIALCASHVVWLHKATAWPNPPLMLDLRHASQSTIQQHTNSDTESNTPPGLAAAKCTLSCSL